MTKKERLLLARDRMDEDRRDRGDPHEGERRRTDH